MAAARSLNVAEAAAAAAAMHKVCNHRQRMERGRGREEGTRKREHSSESFHSFICLSLSSKENASIQ